MLKAVGHIKTAKKKKKPLIVQDGTQLKKHVF